jgi:carbamoyl-phosphate synthase large subunit
MAEVGKSLESEHGDSCKVYAGDANPHSASFWVVDHILLPRYDDICFPERLLNFCEAKIIQGIVPMGEREYDRLLELRETLAHKGTRVILPPKETVHLCKDKWKLAQFLRSVPIGHPATFLLSDQEMKINELPYPLYIKPRVTTDGGFQGLLEGPSDVIYWRQKQPRSILQELVKGKEVTVDILTDRWGTLINYVPRERIFVRGGEVYKGRSIRDRRFDLFCEQIVHAFRATGILTVQCFLPELGPPILIEINTRIGGGFPLTVVATEPDGFGTALFRLVAGNDLAPRIGQYRQLTMLRFDQDIIFEEKLK